MGHRRRARQHRRGQPPGPGRQPRIPVDAQMIAVQPLRAAGASAAKSWHAPDYHLEATLTSGQTFRWRRGSERGSVTRSNSDEHDEHPSWEGVVAGKWVRLHSHSADRESVTRGTFPTTLHAQLASPVSDWQWLEDYLQVHV